MGWKIDQRDTLEWLQGMPDDSATAILCDPPYGLSFMGKEWDGGVPSPAIWAEAKRVAKPGAILMAFGGTRTWHRLAVNLEDAGWEIADTLMWLYGSGFPKSHSISKAIDRAEGAKREVVGKSATCIGPSMAKTRPTWQNAETANWADANAITTPATPDAQTWDGYGTALKPAWEPIILCRAPRGSLRYVDLALEFGTGALWIDGCRIGTSSTPRKDPQNGNLVKAHMEMRPWMRQRIKEGLPLKGDFLGDKGRWPANLLLSRLPECEPECPVAMLDEQSGVSISQQRIGQRTGKEAGRYGCFTGQDMAVMGHSDLGGASRFFYTAKAGKSERNAGLPEGMSNKHPTVKPLKITEYLARLLRPPMAYLDDALMLVPYAGSGSEMIGAILAGWRNVWGCDIDGEYCELAQLRLRHWAGQFRQMELFDASG